MPHESGNQWRTLTARKRTIRLFKSLTMRHIIPFLVLASMLTTPGARGQQRTSASNTPELPARYFELLDSATSIVEKRLDAEPGVTLASLESQPGWSHFPNAILMPAVLFTKSHPANKRYGDASLLQLALRIGDFLATEQEKGNYSKRHDSDWDTYMWLEAYRVLENKLGENRRQRWKKVLLEEISLLEPKLVKCLDYPWYNAPFIITSPNHYAIYASTLLVGGKVFDKPDWVKMSTEALHRFCVREQAPDGYWGEHSQAGPTTGYDYLTLTQIAVYWEHSKDPEALNALRRSTDFHEYYTYPDGTPVETINDRNRYWDVSMWGHFGFSHWPDGRKYAAFLTSHFPFDGTINGAGSNIQSLGRIAQSALYFHEGKTAPTPQDQANYAHAMKIPAGIRKAGPWVITYSGIIAPPVSMNNFFLDRQANFSIFNSKTGLIISGANSKRQPELATFTEVIRNDSLHMPVSSYFNMSDQSDRLALAYNSYFGTIDVPKPSEKSVKVRIATTYKWGDAVSGLNLQLVLKPGQVLETAMGRKVTVGEEKIDWSEAEMGGWIKHNGWIMRIPAGMHLTWPVYPFNPYADKPETDVEKAVGRLSTALKYENQTFDFGIETE